MRTSFRLSFLVILAFFVFTPTRVLESKVYRLYFLGGQSNMDGYGQIKKLPENLNSNVKGVMIFHGNSSPEGTPVDGNGIWQELRPGHGVGFSSDGRLNTYSDRFGVELTFARRLMELDKDSHIALIKYSRGGTSIDIEAAGTAGCWDPDYAQKKRRQPVRPFFGGSQSSSRGL